jgi:transcriptional regulator
MTELPQVNSKPALVFNDAVEVWLLRRQGWHQHEIAARFGVNPGRVSEVLKERKHLGSRELADVFGRKA